MMTNRRSPLDTFDHVVVLMLENRSFDNILGYLYPARLSPSAPLGQTFEGLLDSDGNPRDLSNPVPESAVNRPPPGVEDIPVTPVPLGEFDCPYPDPGEEYPHINTQLFGIIDGGSENPPWNLPPGEPTPKMDGFVTDYIRNFKYNESANENPRHVGRDPTYDEYRQIMQCYTPEHLPVLSTLAREFAVFDHWFAAVPSQTFCNRAFWHAGTSWGRLSNEPYSIWQLGSGAETLFNQISASQPNSGLDWKIYSENIRYYSLTTFIHEKALASYAADPAKVTSLDEFIADCAAGALPAYSFIEPRFVNPHNDMHPSSTTGQIDGPNPPTAMEMGELLVWQVYEAVRTSASSTGSNADNTLLIITFDEHGGCYDHVPPPPATPPQFDRPGQKRTLQDGFDYTRLGVRVPTIMISAHIAPGTVVNAPKDHCSFMATMREKWDLVAPNHFLPLTARVAAAPTFKEVFTAEQGRLAANWPKIAKPDVPDVDELANLSPPRRLNDLQRAAANAHAELRAQGHPAVAGKTVPPG